MPRSTFVYILLRRSYNFCFTQVILQETQNQILRQMTSLGIAMALWSTIVGEDVEINLSFFCLFVFFQSLCC